MGIFLSPLGWNGYTCERQKVCYGDAGWLSEGTSFAVTQRRVLPVSSLTTSSPSLDRYGDVSSLLKMTGTACTSSSWVSNATYLLNSVNRVIPFLLFWLEINELQAGMSPHTLTLPIFDRFFVHLTGLPETAFEWILRHHKTRTWMLSVFMMMDSFLSLSLHTRPYRRRAHSAPGEYSSSVFRSTGFQHD